MKLKKLNLKKLAMLTLPVAAISVAAPIVLTSCGTTSSDSSTDTSSKVSWKDQTASDFEFGGVTGTLTIANGAATLDFKNQKVEVATLQSAITSTTASTTFESAISVKINDTEKLGYKSAEFTANKDKTGGVITVTMGDSKTTLTITVTNLQVTTSSVSWKDQDKSEFNFGGIKGNLTITSGVATLDFEGQKVEASSLTNALTSTSTPTFETSITAKINDAEKLGYKSATFEANTDKTGGTITVTMGDSKTTLIINVTNLQVSTAATVSWKDQDTAADITFAGITGNLAITSGKATLDMKNNVEATKLQEAISSTTAPTFQTVITAKINNPQNLGYKSASFAADTAKTGGTITITMGSDSNTVTLTIAVSNLKASAA